MDRSDPPHQAAVDPTTVKTEPPVSPPALQQGAPAPAVAASESAPPSPDRQLGSRRMLALDPPVVREATSMAAASPVATPAAGDLSETANAPIAQKQFEPQQDVSLQSFAAFDNAPSTNDRQPGWPPPLVLDPTIIRQPAEPVAYAVPEPSQSADTVAAISAALAQSPQQTFAPARDFAASDPPAPRHFDATPSEISLPLAHAEFDVGPTRWSRWDAERVNDLCVRGAKVAAIVFGGWLAAVLLLILVYRFINPPVSSLMVLRWLGGTSIRQEWVPIERISPNLVRAVIVSEDGRFCQHWGIDFAEVAAAIKRSSGGVPRGASTITMQVAKNLFLLPAKSYVRKVVEVPLTYAIELFWPKWRILEVYLNVAEWGPGVFGAESAAKSHFGRSARALSARQAAQLAVALPNPVARDAGAPGPWSARRASVIQHRAARTPEAASCVGWRLTAIR